MKVLVVARMSDLLAGASVQLRMPSDVRALRAAGHEIVLLGITETPWRSFRGAPPRTSEVDGVQVVRIDLPMLPGPAAGLLDALLRRALLRALRTAGVTRPDVVHVHADALSMTAGKVLSVVSGTPFVISADEFDVRWIARDRVHEPHCAQALLEAHAVAVSSDSAGRILRSHWVVPRIEVVPGSGRADTSEALTAVLQQAVIRADRPQMVFHAPYPLDPAPASASRHRPNMMLEAFIAADQQPHVIVGNPQQRRQGFSDLRRRVRAGQNIEFVYSENSTQPNLLSTSIRHGLAPLLEAAILQWARRRGIPFGQFYRDVYWRFPEKQAHVALYRRAVMQMMYRFDLLALLSAHAHFFIPSMPMRDIIPAPTGRCTALPPGASVTQSERPAGLHLLYVGGVGPGHEIEESLEALREVPEVDLTMVVPARTWQQYRERYEPLLTPRVRVVHAGASELPELYDRASACLLIVEPNEYRKFAVPMKLYEYLGYGKPTLASAGTLAGDIVRQLGIGYVTGNDRREIADLLRMLHADPHELGDRAEHVEAVRYEETWEQRARTVRRVLTGENDA
ncbi:glycosyltransferase [Brachybacterium sp. p3-SID957]|uniref:glycosyltransferase n=1 Tax=Brachybacterium sp. p3-SID957 TaxID=2916049 RepID=UPI00223B546C|nr:glycosyltransferase [Brachybacterium sp. p3-SID957]MCT1775054.1 glycosyltransferase [Brachybacterium sp. p3-SID957]